MSDLKKNQHQDEPKPVEETRETETSEETPSDQDRLKETTEKIWGSTRSAWSTATFKASQYRRLVQKKIDLAALHKKIGAAHAELGKLIDDMREAGQKSIMTQAEVKEIFKSIDSLKAAAAALEEEIEHIKEEAPANAAESSAEDT